MKTTYEWVPILWAALSLALTACGDDAGGGAADDAGGSNGEIEVAGTYDSDFGAETIDSTMWNGSDVVDFDNDDNWAVTQNADDADFDPGKFNKVVWTEPAEDGAFHYCTVDFGLGTADEAVDTELTADDTDPESGGCGGFPWTLLTPAE
ncbi:MAG: hypothetical protein PVI30_16480 [Myxococcales bacterium]|jgi:hypothetical protein